MAVASSCLDDPNQAVSDYFHNKGGKQDLRILRQKLSGLVFQNTF